MSDTTLLIAYLLYIFSVGGGLVGNNDILNGVLSNNYKPSPASQGNTHIIITTPSSRKHLVTLLLIQSVSKVGVDVHILIRKRVTFL